MGDVQGCLVSNCSNFLSLAERTKPLYGSPITSGCMEMGGVRFNPTLLLCRLSGPKAAASLSVRNRMSWDSAVGSFSRCCVAHTDAGSEL